MRCLARTLFVVAALAAVSCNESPSSPGSNGSAHVALAPNFSKTATLAYSALASFGLDVTSAHLHLTAPDGSARDTTIAFPLTTDTLQIDMAVPLRTVGEDFTADLELTNSDGIVLFTGRQIVTAHASDVLGHATVVVITINYTGPGHDVKSLTVTPATQVITGAGSTTVTATGVDAANAPVQNLLVRWTSSDASIATVTSTGSAIGTVTTTGKRGTATITATTAVGITASAAVVGVPVPAKVVVISGANQTGPAGTALVQPLVVEVQAADNLPVPGAPVTFRAVTAGASVTTASTLADASGRASSTLKLGPAPGTYQFETTSGTLTPTPVSATATAALASAISIVSGNGQVGVAGSALAQPLVVVVKNASGGVVGGATVQWTKLSASGTLSAASSVSATDGTASVGYTLGTSAVSEVIRASLPGIAGAVADFTVFPTAGPPYSIAGTGENQHAPAGSPLPAALTARVLDVYGNPVPGVTVTWSVTSAGGATAAFSPASGTTDNNGQVQTTVTLNGSAGPLTITASAAGFNRNYAETADQGTSNPGSLSGFVYDAVTGSPLNGVTVTINQGGQTVATVQTSGGGNFSTAQLTGGVYDLQYAITGYVTTAVMSLTINGATVAPVIPLVPASQSPGSISGFVFDATTNQAVQGTVTLELRPGVNATTGTPLQSITTSGGAAYLFSSVPAGTYTIVAKSSGYADATQTGIAVGATTTSNQNLYISPAGVTGLVRIVLTWRALPSDLDSYLSGPIANSTSRFLVWYGNRQNCATDTACLDQDVTSGFGPETVTITQLLAGTYYYSVNNYSQNGALSQSGARVDVYINNALAQSFFVPAGNGVTWQVFQLNGTTITPINAYGNVLTSRGNVRGISASMLPTMQTTTVVPYSDDALIAEMVRLHPKPARRAPR